jgi:dolichol-phosphate mannosyltransferase
LAEPSLVSGPRPDVRPLVVVPTYNERGNLATLVEALLHVPGLQVLIVDDASPDGTGELADGLARDAGGRVSVLHRTGPRGFGRAHVDGIRRALDAGATAICQMDADLSHDPADVPRLLAHMATADLAIGSRYVPGGRIENWPRRRMILSHFANRYVRALTGLRVRDCTSGFRCWRREAIERLPFDRIASEGYAFLVELVWEATSAGCRIVEVPITFVERRAGASKLSPRVILESALLPWRLAWRRLWLSP